MASKTQHGERVRSRDIHAETEARRGALSAWKSINIKKSRGIEVSGRSLSQLTSLPAKLENFHRRGISRKKLRD